MAKKAKTRPIVEFIAEAGMLKRVPRSGWSVLGIANAESVADHSFRCAVIGYTLACMEGVSAYPVLLMTLFNDIHEARLTDLHKMAQRYVDAKRGEKEAFKEQILQLPSIMRQELESLRKEYDQQKTTASIIARDADILECLIQAKEYLSQGFRQAAQFMRKAPQHLKTKSAKALWKDAKASSLNDWWFRLSEFKR